ncbi:FAD/NAD(P)-binding domain-containing protein [Vararia minispora EC-137]|uniref:FAD/NAD(P)-binding domain-containing protein n=1 Tax=Vararia minispora EC-137 TaxID=1314806 RepID=A0ACB8QK51_9AGAM|nr:FAD/NAD(P)-binding domain-containing protein [Vararia minispora EC-137]
MVNLRFLTAALLSVTVSKRIAIVGMGAGGISALKALLALPEEMREGWEIVAFEQREEVGGLWLPQMDAPSPPEIPETPLYPDLRTNGPHPLMTIPHFPFPPETPLLAPHDAVLRYHQDTVSRFGLARYIRLQHVVLCAAWVGNSTVGHWNLLVEEHRRATTSSLRFDHLIAAPGVNRTPRYPDFDGRVEWLVTGKTIIHCIYFRDPRAFSGRNVVVVGGGPSGWDMVRQIVGHARTIYWSRDTKEENPLSPGWPSVPGVLDKPRISSLAGGIVTFKDGSSLSCVDTLLLATGYDLRIPFLTSGGVLAEVDGPQPADELTTNGRYVHPLYEHTLSLDPTHPLGTLYFVGLILYNPTGMCDYAQGLFAAYTIADPRLLAPRDELYASLKARERQILAEGFDPAHYGHKVGYGYGPTSGHGANGSFEDLLVDYLRARGLTGRPGIPMEGMNYTEPWRVESWGHGLDLLFAWNAGEEREGARAWNMRWTRGRRTEADYAALMREVSEWWDGEKARGGETPVEEA